MNYKIVVDSCGELTEEMKQSGYFESVAMSIELEGSTIVDDETFDKAAFLNRLQPVENVRSRLAHLRNVIWKAMLEKRNMYTL